MSKGRITIPVEIRQRYGLKPGDEFEFIPEEKRAYLIPIKRKKLSELYGSLSTTKAWPGIQRAREIAGNKLAEEHLRKRTSP